jgi:hypothetical protein
VRSRSSSDAHVVRTCVGKTPATVRTTTYHVSIVIVLAVVFPPALATYLVPAALRERGMPAAGARVRAVGTVPKHVSLPRVLLKPASTLGDHFFVAQRRVIIRTPYDDARLVFWASMPIKPGHKPRVCPMSLVHPVRNGPVDGAAGTVPCCPVQGVGYERTFDWGPRGLRTRQDPGEPRVERRER